MQSREVAKIVDGFKQHPLDAMVFYNYMERHSFNHQHINKWLCNVVQAEIISVRQKVIPEVIEMIESFSDDKNEALREWLLTYNFNPDDLSFILIKCFDNFTDPLFLRNFGVEQYIK